MKISELISALQSIRSDCGDLPIFKHYDELQFEIERAEHRKETKYYTTVGNRSYPDRVVLLDPTEFKD